MAALLDHLPMLAQRDFAGLRRVCGVDDEDLAEMIAEIKALNPKPGEAFEPPLDQPVVPDVIVRRGPDGGWLIELNTDTLPRVLVNNAYYSEVSRRTGKDTKAKERSEEHTSELQSLMRISHAVFCLKKKTWKQNSR